ncbi:MAG: hypothetical protein GF320_03215 [Armatimonadia bacterium]|nr:hypothetical protein [Armatimonadia bacterium]
MDLRNLPVQDPKPSAEDLVAQIRGERVLDRVPLIEYIVDPVVMRPIVTELLGREWVDPGPEAASWEAYLDNLVAMWHRLGYDIVRLEVGLPFSRKSVTGDDPTMAAGQRVWWDEHEGTITSWEQLETYPWPDVSEASFWVLERICERLPEGMGFVTCHGGGPYEHLSSLLSYEQLSYLLVDDPPLVKAICENIGKRIVAFYERILELPGLVMVLQGDDMGFRTGTLISPDHLRELILPWHEKMAAMAHAKGLPYCLHSCGEISKIMPDLIEGVSIDGKHSFEDAILPIEKAHERWGGDIALLGGVDVDLLTRGSTDDVRKRVRKIVEACAPKGRFALGSGNSIASYVPAENYLAMLDEGLAMG